MTSSEYRPRHLLVSLRSAPLLSAWRHACHSSRAVVSCFLVARTQSTSDERVTLEVDRFDPGRTDGLPTSLLPSDLAIACDIVISPDPSVVSHLLYNLSTFHEAFSFVTQSMRTISSLDIGRVLAMKACLVCSHEYIYSIEFACIIPKDNITVAPIRDIPIVPTALARNLVTALSLSALQGQVKHGYVTMDTGRKLLLLLHSDPKVTQLPLVGIWLSGVESAGDVRVWKACTQYCFSGSLRDSVWHEDGGFLALVFTIGASTPVLLHCRMVDYSDQFELGHAKIFPKEVALGGSVSFTLDPMASSTSLHTLFMAAKQTYSNAGAMEGPQPSPQPSPHPSQSPSLIKGAHLLSVSLPCIADNYASSPSTGIAEDGTSKAECHGNCDRVLRDGLQGYSQEDMQSCCHGSMSYSASGGVVSEERGGATCITDEDRSGSSYITGAKQAFDWSILEHSGVSRPSNVTLLPEHAGISQPSNTTFSELSLPSTTTMMSASKVPTTTTMSASNDEMFGNMSFATVEYLRRYHLLDSDELLDIPNLKMLPKLL